MNSPNYRNFYQKALIPIGLKDQTAMMDLKYHKKSPPLLSTHWLIALESIPTSSLKEYDYWKVFIYPSHSDHSFQWEQPFYSSPEMESLDQALSVARRLETCCKGDELLSTDLQEKIS